MKRAEAGERTLRYEFEPTDPPDFAHGRGTPGLAHLYVDGELVGNAETWTSTPQMLGVLGASCGSAAFDSVDPSIYAAPFRFTGTIRLVVIDVTGDLISDDEVELRRLMVQR